MQPTPSFGSCGNISLHRYGIVFQSTQLAVRGACDGCYFTPTKFERRMGGQGCFRPVRRMSWVPPCSRAQGKATQNRGKVDQESGPHPLSLSLVSSIPPLSLQILPSLDIQAVEGRAFPVSVHLNSPAHTIAKLNVGWNKYEITVCFDIVFNNMDKRHNLKNISRECFNWTNFFFP